MPNIHRDMLILQAGITAIRTQKSLLEVKNTKLKKENGFLEQENKNLRKIALICTEKYDPSEE